MEQLWLDPAENLAKDCLALIHGCALSQRAAAERQESNVHTGLFNQTVTRVIVARNHARPMPDSSEMN